MSELWAHQSEAIEKARILRDLAIYHDPGVGKTRTAIEILKEKFNAGKRIQKTLVLGPVVVLQQWVRQFALYSKIPKEKIIVLEGDGAKRAKLFSEMQLKHPTGFIALLNYEGLLIKKLAPLIADWQPEILILDECHRMKDSTRARFKVLKPIADGCDHRYLLTGSPILNSEEDLFAQYRLLNRGESFMGYNPRTKKNEPMGFHQWQRTYFYDANAGMPPMAYFPNWRIRPGSQDAFRKIMQETAVQAKKEEVLDLPPLVHTELPINLGRDQKNAYNQMSADYIALVQGNAITASLAIVQSLRLQQILAGFVPGPEGEALWFEDVPRLTALVEKTKDLVAQGKKVIIWTGFVPTYDRIEKELKKAKIESTFLTGRESTKQKNENVLKFTKGTLPVAICNPQAVSLGIELTEAQYSIYYTRSYSLEHLIQSTARNHRGGSEMHEHVTHYDLVAKDTLDEIIMNCLKGKTDVAEALLKWAKGV